MRDDESRLGELFDATRSVERAPNASREVLRHAVTKHLMTAGVLATSAAVAKSASAATAVGSSGVKISSFLAGVSTKFALGAVAAATALGGIGYVLHATTRRSTDSTQVQSSATSARASSSVHTAAIPLLDDRTPHETNAAPTSNANTDPNRGTTSSAATDTNRGTTSSAATDANRAAPVTAADAQASGNRHSPAPRTSDSESKLVLPSTKRQKESLAEELALIRAAQSELNAGHSGEALILLQRYFRDFPRGTLTQEAQVARIRSLCLSGRRMQAESEASRFVRANPNSPLAARVRGGCAAP